MNQSTEAWASIGLRNEDVTIEKQGSHTIISAHIDVWKQIIDGILNLPEQENNDEDAR